MHFKPVFFIVFTIIMVSFCGNLSAKVEDALVKKLTQKAYEGELEAVKGLASLIDVDRSIRGTLADLFVVAPQEFQFTTTFSKQAFFDFYYTNEHQIHYSDLLNAFYLTTVESRKVECTILPIKNENERDPSILLRLYQRAINDAFMSKESSAIQGQIRNIVNLQKMDGFDILINCIEKRMIHALTEDQSKITNLICDALKNYPSQATFNAYMQLLNDGLITDIDLAPHLRRITNTNYDVNLTDLPFAEFYQEKLDSIGSLDKVRAIGYQQYLGFTPAFFQEKVDYYGMVLGNAEQFPWIRANAIADILKTKHPRALFYIGAQVFQYRNTDNINLQNFVDVLSGLTETNIQVLGNNGLSELHDWQTDRIASENYMLYWATHHDDFEWDEIKTAFVNKEMVLSLKENYERLFRRLNSESNFAALQAYELLVEGNPAEVIALAKKYKDLLRNYNNSLPSLKYRFLEQLVQLTAYCRKNKVNYRSTSRVSLWLNKLEKNLSPSQRYDIENQILERLRLDEITAIEYWACMREGNPEVAFSVGRILDRLYARYWDDIVNDPRYLRLYLKKSKLFADIGVIGICNTYLNKFETLDVDLENNLRGIKSIESDKDIIAQINALLSKKYQKNTSRIQMIWLNPASLSKQDLKTLPTPNEVDYKLIYEQLTLTRDPLIQKKLMQYLTFHPDINQVPMLMSFAENQIAPELINKYFEKIYHYKQEGGIEEWLSLWQKQKRSYRKWSKRFFVAQLDAQEKAKVADIKIINILLQSEYYEPVKHKNRILALLPKLKSNRYLRRLKPSEPLDINEDLVWFKNLNLKTKELDDVPGFFKITASEIDLMLAFVREQSADFNVDDKGALYNNLFRYNWFADLINQEQIAQSNSEAIIEILDTYLQESDLISAFEEQATVRNISLLRNIGLPLTDKIQSSRMIDADDESIAKVQESILAQISFEEIPSVLPYLNDLKITQGVRPYNFLNKDFGLPIFDITDVITQDLLAKRMAELTPSQLYRAYLDDFQVDYQSDGELDFEKIHDILLYDVVRPFVGDGGVRRDYFTYGVIKILEFHFDENLDFHEKLNENQTFYSFSSIKRTRAWMQYLRTNGYVNIEGQDNSSFNSVGK